MILPLPLGDHRRRQGLGQKERRPQIDGLAAVPILDAGPDDGLDHGNAGVVDENVDRPEGIKRAPRRFLRPLDACHLRLDHHAATALALDRGAGLLEAGRIACHRHDVGARIGQHLADLEPDAFGRARHQRPLAGQREPLDEIRHKTCLLVFLVSPSPRAYPPGWRMALMIPSARAACIAKASGARSSGKWWVARRRTSTCPRRTSSIALG